MINLNQIERDPKYREMRRSTFTGVPIEEVRGFCAAAAPFAPDYPAELVYAAYTSN